ncbi:MAG: SixA phosphatase family protein [Flavitalea sp.]
MKKLLVIRHAKSSWDDIRQTDFERPLNERGKRDAPEMAKRLNDKGIIPDLLVSSPAKRAISTAKLFAKEFRIEEKDIHLEEKLYHPEEQNIFTIISRLPAFAETVILFSHNPGITGFVNMLTNTRIDHMPTSAIFAINIKSEDWIDFENAEKEFWFFDYPKSQ